MLDRTASTLAMRPQRQQVREGLSDAQLHARACIVCGRDDVDLNPAGHVQMENRPGQLLPWAVVACPEHRSAA